MPAAMAPARKPGGIRARLLDRGPRTTGTDPGQVTARAGAARGRSSSGSPKTTLNACTAWPAAPFTRLSMTDSTRTRPGSLVRVDVDRERGCCRGRAWSPAARRRARRTARRRRTSRYRSSSSAWSIGRTVRTWHADEDPAGHRDQVRQEVDRRQRRSGASRPSSCSISATCRWPVTPYARTLSLTSLNRYGARASRPAPETPLLASTTTSPRRPARGERRQGEDAWPSRSSPARRRSPDGRAPRARPGAAPGGRTPPARGDPAVGARSRTSADSRSASLQAEVGPEVDHDHALGELGDRLRSGAVREADEHGVELRRAAVGDREGRCRRDAGGSCPTGSSSRPARLEADDARDAGAGRGAEPARRPRTPSRR